MAKLLDKLYNRLIEGKLKIESDDNVESLKETLGLDSKATIHYTENGISNENTDFYKNIKIGDIICDTDYPAIWIVELVTIFNTELVEFRGVGFETDVENPADALYSVIFIGEEWNYYPADIRIRNLIAETTDAGKFLQVQSDGKVAPATVPTPSKGFRLRIMDSVNTGGKCKIVSADGADTEVTITSEQQTFENVILVHSFSGQTTPYTMLYSSKFCIIEDTSNNLRLKPDDNLGYIDSSNKAVSAVILLSDTDLGTYED